MIRTMLFLLLFTILNAMNLGLLGMGSLSFINWPMPNMVYIHSSSEDEFA